MELRGHHNEAAALPQDPCMGVEQCPRVVLQLQRNQHPGL